MTTPSPKETAPEEPTEESRIVAGYRVGEEMGQGPLGKIYRAENVETGTKVVFRGFTRPYGADPAKWDAAKDQFRDLLQKQQAIDRHPVIQDIIAFGEENGIFWIATEYFEGRTLQQIMASEGAQSLMWCLEVMKQVADAVDYAAEKGLVHTDLTPYNVLLVNHPENPNTVDVRVINFGLAHARPKYGSRYAAPEQQDGFEGDRRSDVYAVGALLLELLTGKPAFTGTSPDEIVQKIRSEDPAKLLIGRPSYVQNVIGAMLTKAPRFRYANVGRAIADLVNKRSPDGADRHDSVEMNTDEMLAVRRAERKTGLTAEEELSGAWREAEDAARFKRLEIGDDTPQIPGAKAAIGRDMKQFAPDGTGRVAIQEFRLSEMDVLEIKWKAERVTRKQEAEREFARERWRPVQKWGIGLGLLALFSVHAATIIPGYSTATVTAATGEVMRQTVPADPKDTNNPPKPIPLAKGETLEKDDLPVYIMTGADGGATLSLANGEAVYVPANSGIEVRELGYDNGVVRRFVLWYGRVAVRTQTALRGKEKFAVHNGEPVTCNAVGDSRLLLSNMPDGGGRLLVVAAPTGTAKIEHPGGKETVKNGEQWTLRVPGGTGKMATFVPASGDTTDTDAEKAFVAVSVPPAFLRSAAGLEENTVLPLVELVKSIALIPTRMNDAKTVAIATTSMQALCTMMATAGGENTAPGSLDLKTLAPLSVDEDDRKRLLKAFDGERLVGYRTLPNGGYEILARAADSKRTWIRGKNGAAKTAGSGNEPK